MCMSGKVVVSLRARLMLRSYNHIECIPLEGQKSDTCLVVACIRLVVCFLCARRILTSTRTYTVLEDICRRSSSRSVAVLSEERRGGRTLTVALSRHMVGLK